MAGSRCAVITDEQGRETVSHGTSMFPLACYEDDLRVFYVGWHWHEEFECIVATEGAVEVLLEGKRLPLLPGEGVFINSGVLHAVFPGTEETAVLRSIVFHPRLLGSADSVFWQKLVAPLLRKEAPAYLRLEQAVPWKKGFMEDTMAVWEAGVSETEDYENFIRYRLSAAFRQLVGHDPDFSRTRRQQDQICADRIKTMLRFIEEHYGEELTVEQIAAAVAVSPSVCLRCFRQMLGTTPAQYLKQLRIEKAAQLLLSTHRTIRDIGMECGFSDLSYFAKTFRGEKGCTPKAYRSAFHEKEGF